MKGIIENTKIMKPTSNEPLLLHQNIDRNTYNLVFVLNINYELIFASPNLVSVLGYEAEGFLGTNFFQHVHTDDCERVKAEFDNSFWIISKIIGQDNYELNVGDIFKLTTKDRIKTFLQNYSKTLRSLSAIKPIMFRVKRKNGKWCWLESSSIPFLAEHGEIMITISACDVTERIKLQEALKFNLKKLNKTRRHESIIRAITQDVHKSINLQEVFDNSVYAIHKNVLGAKNVAIYIIENGNAVIKSHNGYPDRFLDRIRIIPYPKDYTWKTIIDEKSIYCADVVRDPIVGRVGREIGVKSYLSMPIRSRSSILGVINISSTKKNIFDKNELMLLEHITQQIETAINNAQKAEKLRKSEKRFRTLFENVPTGVYRITPDGQILDANPSFIAMLGFSSIEELAVNVIHHQHFRCDVTWEEVRKTIDRHGEIKGMESVWNKRDGTKIFVLENITVLRTDDGNILFYEGTVEEITERKVAENKLKEVNLNLEKEISRRTALLIKANKSLRKEISEKRLKEVELENSYKQLRALTTHLESVREEERTKISREVHDELGQSLTGLKIDLDLLSKHLCESDDNSRTGKLTEMIRKMSALVDYNIQSVRRIAMELRPGILDDLGMVAAIEWQVQDFEKLTGIKCIFSSEAEDIPLDREVSTALFRIFQEVITNIARHSKATVVNVNLKDCRSEYVLVVEDNGVGISNDEIIAPQSLGLLGIKERALIFGGNVKITGEYNKGTNVSVNVPKARCSND